MSHEQIAEELAAAKERITLIYAFNATGKTRLSVAYKNATKDEDGTHAGVYYNAYSEDLFVWDNDSENGEVDIQLDIRKSNLNRFHSSLTEDDIRNKLNRFRPDYRFDFIPHENPEDGIKSVMFFDEVADPNDPNIISKVPRKISRGEERIFVWCFFLALFEVEGWADKQSAHFFIDDPVSSLDDHNIFITASTAPRHFVWRLTARIHRSGVRRSSLLRRIARWVLALRRCSPAHWVCRSRGALRKWNWTPHVGVSTSSSPARPIA